ncbi:MAG TPA: AAA family ATPase [Myxococcota bacterium]|nr:AAA family ATPase [Myxococcota bacterium]HRY93175.1 AAA family ATPase [Myxococcota bacterium]HSA21670.1 AAA family ATPase [Myxococcota bacterium]
MAYVPRLLDLGAKLKQRSAFLFGPRQTGKTTLLREALPAARTYNLLQSEVYLELGRRPALLREECRTQGELIVIDEVQRLPELLNEVHLLIEERRARFLLTGSSARKLRRGGVNLLGGRARTLTLHPFVRRELGRAFELERALNHGLIPSIYLSDSPEEDLRDYAGSYLREEVAAEGLTRNVPAFGRFLEVAALCHGTLINLSKIASDAQVPRSTVQEYFQILQDTLLAHTLPAWKRGLKRKPIGTSKFYLFDPGVARHLRREGPIQPRSPAFGLAFETYLFHELSTRLDYRGDGALAFWRSTSGFEVDFILDEHTAVEVKAREVVSERDLKGLMALAEEGPLKRRLLVCLAARPRRLQGVDILPWQTFLDALWDGEYD